MVRWVSDPSGSMVNVSIRFAMVSLTNKSRPLGSIAIPLGAASWVATVRNR